MAIDVVILAAGKGTRMRSRLPKVLQPLAGRPLLAHVLERALALLPQQVVVVIGHGAEAVQAAFAQDQCSTPLRWVIQEPQRGTGDALRVALPLLEDSPADRVLVLYGDVPLISVATLQGLIAAAEGEALALLTVALPDPTGYGRIVRGGSGEVVAIVEERDATVAERAIREVNTGVMVLPKGPLARWLAALSPNNAQGEYYLTDVVRLAVAEKVAVRAVAAPTATETLGVNDKAQLATLERLVQQQQAAALLAAGVTLLDPERIDIRGILTCGQDVEIDVGCIFTGRVHLADGVRVGAYSVLENCTVGAGTRIEPFCHLSGATIGAQAVIGPYARIRPTTELADEVHVGNFVEVKNSAIGPQSKANHLSYLGDATVGARVNIGAGTITCNYDGANKHRTVIEDEAFIGSDCQLVAPVRVGAGATLGAGTTLTKDAPAQALTLSRVPQRTIEGWQRPRKVKAEDR